MNNAGGIHEVDLTQHEPIVPVDLTRNNVAAVGETGEKRSMQLQALRKKGLMEKIKESLSDWREKISDVFKGE